MKTLQYFYIGLAIFYLIVFAILAILQFALDNTGQALQNALYGIAGASFGMLMYKFIGTYREKKKRG